MLLKRLFFSALLLVAFVIIGCTTTGKAKVDPSTRYSYAHDSCIKFGHRRGTYDYNRCMEKILGVDKINSASERETEQSDHPIVIEQKDSFEGKPEEIEQPGIEQKKSIETKLLQLKRLLDRGLITKDDYEKKKAELLENF